MRILITASSGFLGSQLAAAFRERGHAVTGTARRPGPEQVRFVLGQKIDPDLILGFDAVIHAAHDFDSAERTCEGTQSLFEAVRRTGQPPRQLFVGSYSARPDAISEYGRVKYALERIFIDAGEAVIRPGLVIGNGGMFGRNLRAMMVSPIIPLLDGGRDEAPVISIGDLIRCTVALVETRQTGAWNLFSAHVPLRGIVDAIAAATGRRPIVLSIPLPVALAAVRWMSRIGIPLPFREDNIRSLQANRTRIHQSDMERLGIVPEGFAEAVRAAVSSARTSL